jgi:hypothetical protein
MLNLFGENTDIWREHWHLERILTFGENTDIWRERWHLERTLRFGENADIWRERWHLERTLTFGENTDIQQIFLTFICNTISSVLRIFNAARHFIHKQKQFVSILCYLFLIIVLRSVYVPLVLCKIVNNFLSSFLNEGSEWCWPCFTR